MEHKKFQFKTGAKKVEKEVPIAPPTPPAQPDVAALLSQLIDQKLAAIAGAVATPPVSTPAPVQDKDFELIEDAVANKEPEPKKEVKAKLPRLTKEKPKLAARKLAIEDPEERVEFEKIVIEFNQARSEKNEAMKRETEGRQAVVAKMGENLIYEGDVVDVNVKEIPNKSVSAERVFKALIDPESTDIEEIKAGIQQLFDLARLGVIEIGKGNFERWVKGHGYDPAPFMVEHEKDRRIYITPK
jgi:hypothetical protein